MTQQQQIADLQKQINELRAEIQQLKQEKIQTQAVGGQQGQAIGMTRPNKGGRMDQWKARQQANQRR